MIRSPLHAIRPHLSVVLICLANGGFAENCILSSKCTPGTDCSDIEMSLAWSDDDRDTITIDDEQMSAQWIVEHSVPHYTRTHASTYVTRMAAPLITASKDRLNIIIAPAQLPNESDVRIVEIPRTYVEYDIAFEQAITLHGFCEGLF